MKLKSQLVEQAACPAETSQGACGRLGVVVGDSYLATVPTAQSFTSADHAITSLIGVAVAIAPLVTVLAPEAPKIPLQ